MNSALVVSTQKVVIVQKYFWGIGFGLELLTCIVLIDGLRRIRVALGAEMFDQRHLNLTTLLTMITTILVFVIICAVELHFRVNDFEALSIWINIP